MSHTLVSYETSRTSMWSCCYAFKEVLPGLLAMFFIAICSNNLMGVPNPFTLENLFIWLDQVIGPVNGQPLFQILNANFVWNAFLLGFIIANVFGIPDSWKRGLSYIHKLMPLGILLLAPHFVFSHATRSGWGLILLAALLMFLTAEATIRLGRLWGMDDRLSGDMAGALATGDPHVTAILMPLLKAKGGQVINALVSVLVFGLVASFALPPLAGLVGLSEPGMGLVSVLGVGNTGQMFNAAFGYGYEAGRWAHYLDPVRHVIMPAGFLYVFFVMFVRCKLFSDDESRRATRPHASIPVFVWVFIALWGIAQFHFFKEPTHLVIFELVKWDFSLAAAALGLSLPLREVTQWGGKGLALAFVVGTIRMVILLAGVLLAIKFQWLTF